MMTTTTFNVQRSVEVFPVNDLTLFKQQMLNWCSQFSICCLLDNNRYPQQYHSYECLLAVHPVNTFAPAPDQPESLDALKQFLRSHNDWLFGHFNYDFAGAATGALPAVNGDATNGFPPAFLFQPETILQVNAQEVTISCLYSHPADIYNSILQSQSTGQSTVSDVCRTATPISSLLTTNYPLSTTDHPSPAITPRITQQEYLDTIHQLQQHILRGDCYEINFCQEFYAANAVIQPDTLYRRLTSLSPTPFAAFYRLNNHYAICASPERYVRKTGNQILSQPIKGTAARITDDPDQDAQARETLLHSSKDRSENVMVVDLVRNDLSKICEEGSVQVEELFGIYAFPQVHQMISTIRGTLQPHQDLADVLAASFPMGSMTGAPKKKVMELIARYEQSQRGLYSGTIGYITPEGDFDFNVVIRSLFYNAATQYLSYQVGGGITFYSNAEKEYEECLLKAKAIQKALQ